MEPFPSRLANHRSYATCSSPSGQVELRLRGTQREALNTLLSRHSTAYAEASHAATTNAADAIMDVVARFPSSEEFLIDASIRTPLALKYAAAAFSTAGFAAESGEKDKTTRYPTTQGEAVISCVIVSLGRHGPHFLALIDRITQLA